MKLVRPFAVTSLTSSNVYETPPAAYNAGTTYALGDDVAVFSGTLGTVYKSLQASNTGHTPASSPAWWEAVGTVYEVYDGGPYDLDDIVADATNHLLYKSLSGTNSAALSDTTKWLAYGPTNLWAMFDQKTGTQTQWLEQVTVAFSVTGRLDTIALLNLTGNAANVTMESGATEIFNQDYSLVSTDGISSLYAYFYEPIAFMRDLLLTNLPIDADPDVTITVDNADGATAKIGNVIAGFSYEIGYAQYGAKVGITDYSRIEEDDFGNFFITPRGYNKRADLVVWIEAVNSVFVYNLLADFRATPVLMIGSESYTSTVQYGLLKDWSVALTYPSHSILDLQFQGI